MRVPQVLGLVAGLACCGPPSDEYGSTPGAISAGDGCRVDGRWIISGGNAGDFAYVVDSQGAVSRPEYTGASGTASLDEHSLLIQADDHPLNVTIRAELAPDCLSGEGVATAETTDPTLAEGGQWAITVRHECTEMIDGREVLAAC